MIGESGVFRHLSRWKGVHILHMKAIDFIAGDGNTLSQEGGVAFQIRFAISGKRPS